VITTRYIGFDPGSRFNAYPQPRETPPLMIQTTAQSQT
jgi:hypothetical protein